MKTKSTFAASLLATSLMIGSSHAATIVENGGGTTGTAQAIDSALDGAGAFTHTITNGLGGDATLIQSGLITTVDAPGGYPGGVTPAQQQLSLTGTGGGSYVITTHDGSGGGAPDMAIDQFTDATFATLTAGAPPRDADRGRANMEETKYDAPGTINVGGGPNLFLEFHEVGGADFTPAITFGYDVLDITNATHRTDFFQFNNLLAASLFDVEVLTDQTTYGFFDSRLTFYDSSGAQISSIDSDAGVGAHEKVTGFTVPGDGILILEVNNSKAADGVIGTYELSVSGTAVPEPTTSALLGLLLGVGFLRRRR